MADLITLVPWASSKADALMAQLRARIDEERANGNEVGLAAVLVIAAPEGRRYETCASPMPVECALWAAEKIKEWAWQT